MKTNKLPLPLFDNLKYWHEIVTPELSVQQQQDYNHAKQFLYSYRGSEATFNSYRREVERLLQWAWLIINKNLTQITRIDFEAFIEFCRNPPKEWISIQNYPRFISTQGQRIANTNWRPFVATVSKSDISNGIKANIHNYQQAPKSLQALFAIIGSFYNYLIQEDYVTNNPVTQLRQKSRYLRSQQSKPVIRRLSELQWAYVIECTETLAQQNPFEHERSLFIMKALFAMYLRVSELTANNKWSPKMGDFKRDHDGNWWFTTVGKGNKMRDIAVSDAMIDTLKRYRKSLGLSPLPAPGDQRPLLKKLKTNEAITSTRQIRYLVQNCFDIAIEKLKNDNFIEDAMELKAATVHWLRHTGISEDVKVRPREHVRDDAGHGSSAITDHYIDVEKRERHLSSRKKKIHPDGEH